jgi:hypothetical protein
MYTSLLSGQALVATFQYALYTSIGATVDGEIPST